MGFASLHIEPCSASRLLLAFRRPNARSAGILLAILSSRVHSPRPRRIHRCVCRTSLAKCLHGANVNSAR